jgi:hypothetical protein
LAFYIRRYSDENDKDGKSLVEWSIYYNDEERPLLEQTNMIEDFHNMLDSEGWEKEAEEIVVAK